MTIEFVEEAQASDPVATEVASELVDRAEISDGRSLIKLSKTEADLATLKADAAAMTFSMATTEKANATRAFRARCVGMRTTLKKNCERLRAPAKDFRDAVIAEERRLTAEIEVIEAQADSVIKADEERRAAEKAERERIAAERVAEIQVRIEAIRSLVLGAADRPSAEVDRMRDVLRPLEITLESFGDRAGEAEQLKRQTMAMLDDLYAKAVRREEEAAEAAVRAEAERVERERIAAEQRAEAERLAAERRELEAQQAAARELQAKIDREAAEARAKADRDAAAARAEQDRIAAEARAVEQRRLDAQAAELRRQREEQEARERAERQAAQAKADAEAAEAARVAREAREAEERAAAAQRAKEEAERAEIRRLEDRASRAGMNSLRTLQLVTNDAGFPALAKATREAIGAAINEAT